MSSVVRVVLVYIAEAHAGDEWPVGYTHRGAPVPQQRTAVDRWAAAVDFAGEYGFGEVLADDPADDALLGPSRGFDASYAAWPMRLYLLADGFVEWVAQPSAPGTYEEALSWLECHLLGC